MSPQLASNQPASQAKASRAFGESAPRAEGELNMGWSCMVIFDTEATCGSDGVVVIGATVTDGIGPDMRFTLRITRPHAERAWQIPYSTERITAQIWVHIDEFQDLVARELAEGKTEMVL